jgi:hypothetical protein
VRVCACACEFECECELSKKNEQGRYDRVILNIPPLKNSISYYIYHYLKPKDSQLFVLKDYDKSNSKFLKKYYLQDFGAGEAENLMRNYRQAIPINICDAILFNLKAFPTKFE